MTSKEYIDKANKDGFSHRTTDLSKFKGKENYQSSPADILRESDPLQTNRQRLQEETEVAWNAVGVVFKNKMPPVEFQMGGEPATVGEVGLPAVLGNNPLSNWDSKLREREDGTAENEDENLSYYAKGTDYFMRNK